MHLALPSIRYHFQQVTAISDLHYEIQSLRLIIDEGFLVRYDIRVLDT